MTAAPPGAPDGEPGTDPFDALIGRVNAGETQAREQLFALAYPELRRLARSRLRDGGRNTYLDTGALVNETYLRLPLAGTLRADHRRAFFAYSAQVMRSVIIDSVREHQARRRGAGIEHLTLDTAAAASIPATGSDVLRVNEALDALAAAEPRLAQVVELRYFGGYGEAEIGETLGIGERQVRRDWAKAQRLLKVLLNG